MSVEEVVRREGGPGPGVQDVLGNLSSDQCAPDDEEMVDAERDLAEDAQWKKIQQNTFTRWANEHLKTVQKNVGNLETDLSDGLRLIALIEVLSGKKLPKHNKRPNFRSQKLENVSVALRFLEKDEGIRIVNIGMSITKHVFHTIFPLIPHFKHFMKKKNSSAEEVNKQIVFRNFSARQHESMFLSNYFFSLLHCSVNGTERKRNNL